MGADLITTFLYYRLGEPQTVTIPSTGQTYEMRPALLDLDKALAAASTLVHGWDTDTVRELAEWHDDYEAGMPSGAEDLADLPEADQRGALEYRLHQRTRELLAPWLDGERTRDIETRHFDSGLAFAVTGGLSYGDGPSDTYDLWTSFTDDERWPGADAVLTAAGFLLDAYKHVTYVP